MIQTAERRAQTRREQEQATQDAVVKRAWESRNTIEDIARETGYTRRFIVGSLERQSLTPHTKVRLTGRRLSFRKILRKVRHG